MKYLICILLFILNSNITAQECHNDQHSTNDDDMWRSCTTSQCPNPARGSGHWVMYDLGHEYVLGNTHFWNYNQSGGTGMGFKDIVIDYSLDGNTWLEAGQFQLPEAPGLSNYEGMNGPDLGGVVARYIVLFTQNNWNGDPCAGLSEFKVEVTPTIISNGWIGVVSTDWSNPDNWGQGLIPNNHTDVTIPGGTPYEPTVNIHAAVRTITLLQNAILTIQSKRKLKISE